MGKNCSYNLKRLIFTGIILSVLKIISCSSSRTDIIFPDPATSDYVLPFPVGKKYKLSQSYCHLYGGHRNRIAYDFAMPVGAAIVSTNDGIVIETKDFYKDGDLTTGHNNRVLIRHENGSIAWYAHLQFESITVSVGDSIKRGQVIGACGNTGNTGNLPHLHFEVFRSRKYDYNDAIPVSFRNSDGPLDKKGGLVINRYYEALPNE